MDTKRSLVAVGTVLVLLVLGYFAMSASIPEAISPEDAARSSEPYRSTLTGVHVCLPHKDTSGPQTTECVFGIRTDDDTYFALDFNMMSQPVPEIQNGERFTASGLVTPIENLSAEHWRKYDVAGIFSVTDNVTVESKEPPVPDTEPAKECYIGGCSAQLCTDEPDMASTCEFRKEYACYQGATCEVQADGECGWTESRELRACLSSATDVVQPI